MITIIHGDNIKESREYFFQLRQQSQIAKMLMGDKLTITDLVEALEGNGLFIETKNIFIESLLSSKLPPKTLDTFLQYLFSQQDATVVVWEKKKLERGMLKKIQKASLHEFSYPQTLFQLLDSIRPANSLETLTLFHKTLQSIEIEIILFMLAKQIRMLICAKAPSGESISEVSSLQTWQSSKLRKQAHAFSLDQLLKLHHKLYIVDVQYKTGTLTHSLVASLDFFLADL